MDFSVNDIEVGTNASEVRLSQTGIVHARVKVSAYLSPIASGAENIPSDRGNYFWKAALNDRNSSADNIHDRPIDQTPYWQVERARIGNRREVPVELVMDGKPVARKDIVADGSIQDVSFDASIERSSWLAVRILELMSSSTLETPGKLFTGAYLCVPSWRTGNGWCICNFTLQSISLESLLWS